MARIRTIKPAFWDHEQLGRASTLARLTFVGLISQADDEGRGKADSEWLWGRLHVFAPPALKATWKRILSELEALKDDDGPLVVFYQVAGASYYWLPKFCEQQYIEAPKPSTLPPPPNLGIVPLQPGDSSAPEGKGKGRDREGKGKTSPNVAPPGTPEGTGGPPPGAGPSREDPVIARSDRLLADLIVSDYRRLDPTVPETKIRSETARALRLGVTLHQFHEDVLRLGERLKIWTIVDGYEHPSFKAGRNGNGKTRENAPTSEPAIVTSRKNGELEKLDEARKKCDQMLEEMDPAEREQWKREAEDAAAKSSVPFGPARDVFVKMALRKRAAVAFSIEGV